VAEVAITAEVAEDLTVGAVAVTREVDATKSNSNGAVLNPPFFMFQNTNLLYQYV
jgi:hypothetical protein